MNRCKGDSSGEIFRLEHGPGWVSELMHLKEVAYNSERLWNRDPWRFHKQEVAHLLKMKEKKESFAAFLAELGPALGLELQRLGDMSISEMDTELQVRLSMGLMGYVIPEALYESRKTSIPDIQHRQKLPCVNFGVWLSRLDTDEWTGHASNSKMEYLSNLIENSFILLSEKVQQTMVLISEEDKDYPYSDQITFPDSSNVDMAALIRYLGAEIYGFSLGLSDCGHVIQSNTCFEVSGSDWDQVYDSLLANPEYARATRAYREDVYRNNFPLMYWGTNIGQPNPVDVESGWRVYFPEININCLKPESPVFETLREFDHASTASMLKPVSSLFYRFYFLGQNF